MSIQSFFCKKFGCIEKYDRLKEKHMKFVEAKDNEESKTMSIACYSVKKNVSNVRHKNNVCSNHMTTSLEVFTRLNKSMTIYVKILI